MAEGGSSSSEDRREAVGCESRTHPGSILHQGWLGLLPGWIYHIGVQKQKLGCQRVRPHPFVSARGKHLLVLMSQQLWGLEE